MPDKNEFTYAHSFRQDGWRSLFTYLLIAILFWLGIRGFAPNFPRQNPVFFTVFTILFLLAGVALILGHSLPNILSDKKFAFAITQERVICKCPAQNAGQSFNILLDDLLTVEYLRKSNGSEEWYLVSCSGERFVITSRYGNPVDEIVRTLVRLRPELRPDKV